MLYFPRKSQGIKSSLPGFVACSEYGDGNGGSLSSTFFSILFQATLQPQLITSNDTGEEEKEGWASLNISLHPQMLSVCWRVGCRPETSLWTQLWSTNRRCSPNPTDINKSTVNSISTHNNWGIGAFLPVLFLLLQSIAPGHLRPTPCGQQLLNCVQGAWRCLGEADLKNRVGSRCTVTKMKEDKHNVQSF